MCHYSQFPWRNIERTCMTTSSVNSTNSKDKTSLVTVDPVAYVTYSPIHRVIYLHCLHTNKRLILLAVW